MIKLLRGNSILLIIAALLILAFPVDALAQENGASAGMLIAAVLEQVGYHAQAQVLQKLGGLIQWAGALVYIGVLFSMILTASLMGNYRSAYWILVGPPLFFWVSGIEVAGSSNTIQGAGVEWRFGAFDDSQVENNKKTMLDRQNTGQPGEVSFLFHKYNELVSEITQKVISVVTNDDIRKQMLFMARQRTMEDLFGHQITQGPVNALAAHFISQCHNEIAFARTIARGNRSEAKKRDGSYEDAKVEYCDLWDRQDKGIPPGAAMNFIYQIGGDPKSGISSEEHFGEGFSGHGVVSCQDMWGWLMEGARLAVQTAGQVAAGKNIDNNAYVLFGEEIWDKVVKDIEEILVDTENVETYKQESPGDPCPGNTQTGGAADQNGQSFEVLERIFAGYLLKKKLSDTTVADFLSRVRTAHKDITPNEETNGLARSNPVTKSKILRRNKQNEFAEARKFEAFMLINLLPYMQGMLLYVLAIIYPFFALLILVPGQAAGFFTWMALWAWIKVWDVGFALIIVADEILWTLMPKTSFVDPTLPGGLESPVTLLEIAFDGDHSFNISMYWMLLSGMIMGIPIVTGHAVLGTKKAVANIMLQGLGDFSENLGNGAADWVGGGNMRGWVQQRERTSVQAINRAGMKYFDGQNARDEALDGMLNTGPFSEMMQNKAGIAALTSADQNLMDAQSRLRNLDPSSAPASTLKAARDDVAAAAVAHQKAGDAVTAPLRTMAKGQQLRGKLDLAAAASFDSTGGIARSILGLQGRGEVGDWCQKQILGALGTSKETLAGELENKVDPDIIPLMVQNESHRLMILSQGMNKEAWAQTTMALAPTVGALGWSTGGLLGTQQAMGEMADLSAQERARKYQYQYQNWEWQQKLSAQYNNFSQYKLLNVPDVAMYEEMKAHDAADLRGGGRGEWWASAHSGVPTDAQYALQQMVEEYEAGAIDLNSESGMQKVRAFIRLATGVVTPGI